MVLLTTGADFGDDMRRTQFRWCGREWRRRKGRLRDRGWLALALMGDPDSSTRTLYPGRVGESSSLHLCLRAMA